MKVEIKVSVVVPVYNVQDDLNRCLDSIINQTLREIEVICVNDGSTDRSLDILNEYAHKDSRIRIINQFNQGLGKARNKGIAAALGKYIGFVDSDDWVDHKMFEELYNKSISTSADVVLCEYIHYYPILNKFIQPEYIKLPIKKSLDSKKITPLDISDSIFFINPGAWDKLYNADFIRRHQFKFLEGKCYEDYPFVYSCLVKSNVIGLIRSPFYYYQRFREGSVSSFKDMGRKRFDIFDSMRRLEEYTGITKHGLIFYEAFMDFKMYHYLLQYNNLNKDLKQEFMRVVHMEYNHVKNYKLKYFSMYLKICTYYKLRNLFFLLMGKYAPYFLDNLASYSYKLKTILTIRKI